MENDIQMVGKLHIELLVYHMKVKLWLFVFLESNEHNFCGLIYSHGDVYFLAKNYSKKYPEPFIHYPKCGYIQLISMSYRNACV